MAKTAYIGVGPFMRRKLPNGYTQIEYIQSTGTQYINTGIVDRPTGTEIYLDIEYTELTSEYVGSIGIETDYAYQYPLRVNSSTSYFGYTGIVNLSTTIKANLRYEVYAKFNAGDQVLMLNDETIYTGTRGGGNAGIPMYLCAINYKGTAKYYAKAKVRSCKILVDGTLMRDYIPCKNPSGAVGMYDAVSGQFFGNAGAGSFTTAESTKPVAKKIKKAYVGVNGIARKIKKSYIGVNGIARETWGGVTWKKYSCNAETVWYEAPFTPFLNGFSNGAFNYTTFYTGYYFSRSDGYVLTGGTNITSASEAVGKYQGNAHGSGATSTRNSQIWVINDITYYDDEKCRMEGHIKYLTSASLVYVYSKGTTSYGEIIADIDALPEEGELRQGSIEGDYCIVRVNDTFYYYEKIS